MRSYTVSARLSGVPVHVGAGRDRGNPPSLVPPTAIEPADTTPPSPALEPDRIGGLELLLDDLVTSWRQTTFYLFHPDGWR